MNCILAAGLCNEMLAIPVSCTHSKPPRSTTSRKLCHSFTASKPGWYTLFIYFIWFASGLLALHVVMSRDSRLCDKVKLMMQPRQSHMRHIYCFCCIPFFIPVCRMHCNIISDHVFSLIIAGPREQEEPIPTSRVYRVAITTASPQNSATNVPAVDTCKLASHYIVAWWQVSRHAGWRVGVVMRFVMEQALFCSHIARQWIHGTWRNEDLMLTY